jgi:hypothetical protein
MGAEFILDVLALVSSESLAQDLDDGCLGEAVIERLG